MGIWIPFERSQSSNRPTPRRRLLPLSRSALPSSSPLFPPPVPGARPSFLPCFDGKPKGEGESGGVAPRLAAHALTHLASSNLDTSHGSGRKTYSVRCAATHAAPLRQLAPPAYLHVWCFCRTMQYQNSTTRGLL